MDKALINPSVLQALREAIGDEAFQEFIKRFMDDCSDRTQRIIESYDRGRFSEVELEAHTLGSSSATYGAFQLEDLCRDIEYAKPNKDDMFRDRIDRLCVLSEESIKALQNHLDGLDDF